MKTSRFERKWFYEDADTSSLIRGIYKSKFNFHETFPLRKVNSIYFDDSELTSIYQNLDGVTEKKKLRVRWYGEKNTIINPVIEIKSKKGFIVNKKTIQMDIKKPLPFDIESTNKIKKIISDKINLTKSLIPTISTHYERYYFVSANLHVRATLDKNLSSSMLYKYCNYKILKKFKYKVLEIKYSLEYDNYVRKNLKNIDSRLSKSSKYIAFSTNPTKIYS